MLNLNLWGWIGRSHRQTLGAWGEKQARKHLKRNGYRILARNLRTRLGEIDIVAEAPDRRTVVVVEVKTILADEVASAYRPERKVNRQKRRKLTRLADQLIRKYRLQDRPVRFDVIAIERRSDGSFELRHHVDAFPAQRPR
jgi:putative endonuclease